MLFISNRYIAPIFTSTRKFLKTVNITSLHCIKIPFDSAQGDSKRVDFAQEGSTQGDSFCGYSGARMLRVLSLARIPISYRYIFMILVCLFTNILTFAQDDTLTAGITEEEKQWIINKTLDSFVFVEGGTFMMGDVGYIDSNGVHQLFTGDSDCLPVHAVTLDSYSIQKYEVSFKEFDLFFKAHNLEIVRSDKRYRESLQPNMPAKYLTWYQAEDYCEWLGELIGYDMSLPTEAQWEYAARSRGQAVAHATDNGQRDSGRNVSGPQHPWYGTPPGTFPPNPLGMYDMSGNLEEWVFDHYSNYPKDSVINPRIVNNSPSRVGRGFHDLYGSVYKRAYRDPDNSGGGNGFRCVCNSTKPVLLKPIE